MHSTGVYLEADGLSPDLYQTNRNVVGGSPIKPLTIERRIKVRINIPFPATVKGIDENGKQFNVETVLDNLNKEGLYMRLFTYIGQGEELNIVFCLSSSSSAHSSIQRVAVTGVVLRVEPQPGGVFGVAVKIKPPCFL